MGVSAIVSDGQITNMGTNASSENSKSNGAVEYKEQFMQLLVAQMKYQDPLEPTSNTEWVSQYATFSQVEQMSNMSSSVEFSRASDMVGKYVVIGPTDENGLTKEVEGTVDYVTYSGSKAYVSVDGKSYLASDVTNVMSDAYKNSVDTAKSFTDEMDKLPTLENLSLEDANTINALSQIYESLSSEVKSMIDSTYVTTLKQYQARIEALLEAAAEDQQTTDTTTADNGSAGTDSVSQTGGESETSTDTASTDTTATDGTATTEAGGTSDAAGTAATEAASSQTAAETTTDETVNTDAAAAAGTQEEVTAL